MFEKPTQKKKGQETPDKMFTIEEMAAMEDRIVADLESIGTQKGNPYHNAEHAKAVSRRVKELTSGLQLPTSESQLMQLAALFHDYGHPGKIDVPGQNEEQSAQAADEFGRQHGLSENQIAILRGLIIATTVKKEGVGAKTDLERLFTLADGADWIGTPEEWLNSRASLIKEVKISRPESVPGDLKAWLKKGLDWVREHRLPHLNDEEAIKDTSWQDKSFVSKIDDLWGDKLREKETVVESLQKNEHSPWSQMFEDAFREL